LKKLWLTSPVRLLAERATAWQRASEGGTERSKSRPAARIPLYHVLVCDIDDIGRWQIMPDLTDNLEHYLAPSEDAIRDVVTGGLVVLDTNVLLEGYRFNPDSRRELFSVLERLGDRLWIPHQVASEFLRNRISVMFGLDSTYRDVISRVEAFESQAESELTEQIRILANRVAMPATERDRIIWLTTESLKQAAAALEDHRAAHGGGLTSPASDPVLDDLRRIFVGKVGLPPSDEELTEFAKEAGKRAEKKIPPGYRDASKEDGSGDYIIWAQAMQEAGRRKLPLLFVTGDYKDDWFLKVKGRTVHARPELIAEARRSASVAAIVAQTESLLLYARKHLQAPVSDETLHQAKPRKGSLRSQVHQVLDEHSPVNDRRDELALMTLVGDMLGLDEIDRLAASAYVRSWMARVEAEPRKWALRSQVHEVAG
jgi:hypothetical protein